jgi:hypothetical protein
MHGLTEEGQLGRVREAALREFGEKLREDAQRLHRAATESSPGKLGADMFVALEVASAEVGSR